MATKRKTNTKADLEDKIAKLEAKLTKLSEQLETKPAPAKPAEVKPAPAKAKPAEPKKDTLPKGSEKKPAEVPKPKETPKQVPATFNEALDESKIPFHQWSIHAYLVMLFCGLQT